MRLVLTPTGWAPFDAEAREFHLNQSSGEPIAAQVIEIEPLHDRDMIEHRRIMATINELAKALHSTPEKVRSGGGRMERAWPSSGCPTGPTSCPRSPIPPRNCPTPRWRLVRPATPMLLRYRVVLTSSTSSPCRRIRPGWRRSEIHARSGSSSTCCPPTAGNRWPR